MTNGLEPTEEYDGRVTVHVLREDGGRERVRCRSYEAAVETVREEVAPGTVAKIEDRDGDVVFTSAEMDIDAWETEWRHARHRLSADGDADVEECAYGNDGCVPDAPCVQCRMDAMRERN